MADILIDGRLAPNGSYSLARSNNIENESDVTGATVTDALNNLNTGLLFDDTLTITLDGQTNFILTHTPKLVHHVVLNRAIYRYSVDFTITGLSFTWLNATVPLNIGDNLYVTYEY